MTMLLAITVLVSAVAIIFFILGFKWGMRCLFWNLTDSDLSVNIQIRDVWIGFRRCKVRNQLPQKTLREVDNFRYWNNLWRISLDRLNQIGDTGTAALLQRYRKEPEQILRKLSILSEVDLNRDFPRK
jgi:hypothetical protein